MRRAKPKLLVLDTKESWVRATREIGDYPAATERSGKWVCFTRKGDAETMWGSVAAATKAGRLGSFSDMGPERQDSDARVIEAHTYDWSDVEDVRRVRAELREIGYVDRIPYKADVDTEAGIYKKTGFKRISRYFE